MEMCPLINRKAQLTYLNLIIKGNGAKLNVMCIKLMPNYIYSVILLPSQFTTELPKVPEGVNDIYT